jgi:nucleotide-binding universal stress UspA family protein
MSTATKQDTPDTAEIPGDWAGSPLSTLHYQTPPTPNTVAKPTIVVGVSGSPASARALRWAAGEAARLDAQLKIVLIWDVEPRAYYAPAITPDDYDRRQERAVSGLAATVRVVLGAAPPDALTVVAQGTPERALVEHSIDADLLVLGEAPRMVSGRSIGPVVRACLSHAHCPVVVVGPEGAGDHAARKSATSQQQEDLQLAAGTPAASGANGRP